MAGKNRHLIACFEPKSPLLENSVKIPNFCFFKAFPSWKFCQEFLKAVLPLDGCYEGCLGAVSKRQTAVLFFFPVFRLRFNVTYNGATTVIVAEKYPCLEI